MRNIPIDVLYDITVFGNASRHRWQRTGVYRVVDEVARALLRSNEVELSFCCSVDATATESSLSYVAEDPVFRHVPVVGRGAVSMKRLQRLIRRLENGPEFIAKGVDRIFRGAEPLTQMHSRGRKEVDVFHSPAFFLPPLSSRFAGGKKFLTIYDLIPILFPALCREGSAEFMKQALQSLLPDNRALCISESTKNDLCGQLPALPPENIFVTYLAASDSFYCCNDSSRNAAVRAKYGLADKPYFLSLSTLEPRKNMDHLIRSFAVLVSEPGFEEFNLVLAGEKGWKYDAILRSVAESNVARDRIIFTGYIDDQDLAPLYSSAIAFVYPSLYEGFGLPPLEAMQCGTPVITSNTSSLPEIVGDAAIMVDPTDADVLCEAMLRLANSSSQREELSQRGFARSAKFSWDRCAEQTLTAYRSALS